MGINALMVDVDGVLVDGRPEDGRHWQTSIEEDLGIATQRLHEQFFAPYWESIVLGRVGLAEQLITALQNTAPHVSPADFISYWFERDSRLVAPLLQELSFARSAGIRVHLATNQEHHMEFFGKVEAAVGQCGDEILLIDDSRQNIEAALKAGWQALHWTKHSSPETVRSLCR